MTEVCSCCKTISGRRSRPRPPILSLEQLWKRAKAPHIPWSEAPEAAKLLQTKMTLFSFGGLRGLWSRCMGWGVFGCNFSWRFQWQHRRPWPTSAAGDIADLSPSTFSYPWQLPSSMVSLSLSPAINLSPVSLSPAIVVHRCRCHRR